MLVNFADIQQDDDATPALFNTRYAAILAALNGNIDDTNLANGAVTNAKLASSAVTSDKMAVGSVNKIFQQRTSQATTGTPSGSDVVYNGFPGTYTFNAIANKVYQIHFREPVVSQSSPNTANNFVPRFYINGTMIQDIYKLFVGSGLGDVVEASIYWKAPASGSTALTVRFLATTNGGLPSWVMDAAAINPATLVVNELP